MRFPLSIWIVGNKEGNMKDGRISVIIRSGSVLKQVEITPVRQPEVGVVFCRRHRDASDRLLSCDNIFFFYREELERAGYNSPKYVGFAFVGDPKRDDIKSFWTPAMAPPSKSTKPTNN